MSIGESRAAIDAASQSSDAIAGRMRQAVEPRQEVERASQRMAELIAELGVVSQALETACDETYEAINSSYGSDDIANLRLAAGTLEGASGDLAEKAGSLAERHESTREVSEKAALAKDDMMSSVASVTRHAEEAIDRGRSLPDVEALEEESAVAAQLAEELSTYSQSL